MVDRLLNFDAKLSNWLSLPLESNWRQLARLVAHLGDGPLVFGGLGLAYGLSWLLDQAQLGQEILTIILIVLAVLIIVTLITTDHCKKR
ncbi:MAG TPA: hypothetical protein VEC93_24705 [Anaerolineae bacterium]|nr:hypothetical protein [Anaerolineae bacterium]